jgi:hypothetical protein
MNFFFFFFDNLVNICGSHNLKEKFGKIIFKKMTALMPLRANPVVPTVH